MPLSVSRDFNRLDHDFYDSCIREGLVNSAQEVVSLLTFGIYPFSGGG
jgi:hypothetical protein